MVLAFDAFLTGEARTGRSGLSERPLICPSRFFSVPPPNQDPCRKAPHSSGCAPARQQDQPVSDHTPRPPTPLIIEPKGPYCDVNQKHYYDFCRSDKKANVRQNYVQFCHSYESICFLTTIFPPVVQVLSGHTLSPLDAMAIRRDAAISGEPAIDNNAQVRQATGLRAILGPGPPPSPTDGLGAPIKAGPVGMSNTQGMPLSVSETGVEMNPSRMGGPGGTGARQSTGFGHIAGSQPSNDEHGGFMEPLAFLGNAGSPYGDSPNGVAAVRGMQKAPQFGKAPISLVNNVKAPFVNRVAGTFVDPMNGVSCCGVAVDAAGLPITAMKGVGYGGLMPFGLGNVLG